MRFLVSLRDKVIEYNRRTGIFPVRVRLFIINFSVVLLFLGIIFLTNALLLPTYYNYTKEKELVTTLHKIAALDFSDTDESGKASYTLGTQLKSMEENNGIYVIILNDKLNFFYNAMDSWEGISPIDRYEGAKQIFNALFEISGDDIRGEGTLASPAICVRRNPKTDTTYLSLFAVIPAQVNGEVCYHYVLLNTSLSAMEEAVDAFNDFALALGIFAMIISLLVSLMLCSAFAKPILRMNDVTKRMAEMDFSVKLEVHSKDELGQLAESINFLSSELETKINQLRVANIQLKKDIEEKERIDLMRQELISNVSHEFKTPLAIIMGYSEGLQLNINNDDEKDYYCSVISDEAVKLNNLAARLLDLAELESGANLEFSEFSLSELAEERLHTMSYIFSERGITTTFHAEGDCTVIADNGRIEEVINNLLTNAQHHTPDGGGISVTVQDEGESVSCTVFNSGSRIPDESLDRIWESFYKVDKARTRKYGGSGLGLKIVSSIVNLHGGSCSAQNTDDGVVFRFALPKKQIQNKEKEW
ncbi:MAG: HAMP domain-containing histidine kinase [Clostridia bacterium]|nr:HAMP domain-containing histidine kinase [Clostridia bacterium]